MAQKEQITEDYVSFEVAKLLKEKGFALHCSIAYREDESLEFVGNYNNVDDDKYITFSRPTQALVIKWLRIKHNIHITLSHWTKQPVGDEIWENCYQAFVNGDAMDVRIFKTPEEATKAAILYCLQNLIK